MASFFKRVVTAALERRQEVRDLNLERQEKAVQVGVERLQEAEKNRIKKVNLIRKRNTKVKPFILSVEEKLGKSISPAVAINLLAETPDPSKAILAAEQMLKTNPDDLSSKQLESDTADVQQQTNQMLSRQGDMTMPVSVQQGKMAGDQAISSTNGQAIPKDLSAINHLNHFCMIPYNDKAGEQLRDKWCNALIQLGKKPSVCNWSELNG